MLDVGRVIIYEKRINMPRITVKTNVYLNKEQKYRIYEDLKRAIERIPCEKGSFVMADFVDEAFMLFGDDSRTAEATCASIEVALVDEAFASSERSTLAQILSDMTDSVLAHTKIPEDRIFAFYRNSPLWSYHRQDIVGTLLKI